jgi:hypothetical protein
MGEEENFMVRGKRKPEATGIGVTSETLATASSRPRIFRLLYWPVDRRRHRCLFRGCGGDGH